MSRSQRYLYFCMFSHVYIFSLESRYNMTGRLLGLLGSASTHQRTIRLFYLQKRYNVHICKCNHIIPNWSKVLQDMNIVWNLVFFALLLQTHLYCFAFSFLFFTKRGLMLGTSWTSWICQDSKGIYIFAHFLMSINSP